MVGFRHLTMEIDHYLIIYIKTFQSDKRFKCRIDIIKEIEKDISEY